MKDQKELLESERNFYELMKKMKEDTESVNINSEELKEDFYNNCMSGEKTHVEKQRKKIRIVDYKKFAIGMIVIALSLSALSFGGIKLSDKIIRDYKLAAANDYMRTKVVTYLEDSDLDYSVLKDKIIFENDGEKIRDFVDKLVNDGFSRDEVIYMISKVCTKKEFDNVVKAYGYSDSWDFLDSNYFNSITSDNGNTVYGKWGSKIIFENNVEGKYVESVNDLQASEENKGLNR